MTGGEVVAVRDGKRTLLARLPKGAEAAEALSPGRPILIAAGAGLLANWAFRKLG